MSAFPSLEQFDDVFCPPSGRKLDVDLVPNGQYEVEIGKAAIEETQKSGDTILKLPLIFRSGNIAGDYTEKPYFFRTHEQAELCGADLRVMGFDVENWTKANGRPLSQELPKAVARMPGLKLKVAKSSRDGQNGKVWHTLAIVERIGPPPADAPASANGAAPQATFNPDIPF